MADQFEQQVRAGADQVAQVDPAVAPGQRDEVVDNGLDARDRLLHLGEPRRAEFGERDLAGVAREQDDAELVLELLDRGGQRRLGDEESLGGAPVVQLLAEHGEVSQLAQRHVGARAVSSVQRPRGDDKRAVSNVGRHPMGPAGTAVEPVPVSGWGAFAALRDAAAALSAAA